MKYAVCHIVRKIRLSKYCGSNKSFARCQSFHLSICLKRKKEKRKKKKERKKEEEKKTHDDEERKKKMNHPHPYP